jgi:deoxyribose-phosphate aldolase
MALGPIALGSDHGGYELKEHLKRFLTSQGHALDDCGAYDTSPCDYPRIAAAVAHKVAAGACPRGIIVDGAGIGSAMTANRFLGVRAALCYDLSSAKNAREHNDANVLTLGARLIGQGLAEQIVATFLGTPCSEERHQRRVALIDEIARSPAACPTCASPPSTSPLGAPSYFTLDGTERRENTPPPLRDASRSEAAQAFRASAARWMSMAETDKLSSEDLERVAARIAAMLAGATVQGSQWCFGDVCVDAAVARQWIAAGVARLSNGLGAPVAADIAGYIDHTLLKPDATKSQVEQLCAEAREHGFAAVCINPTWVPLAARLTRGSSVVVCTVVGFPLGATHGETKALEARRAIREGAREIDTVINIGALKSGDDREVFRDIRAVVDACEDGRALCKVIIETALLSDEEKVRACTLAKKARADFVKTSTGFASGGATAADVALMARAVQDVGMGVKASGGVKNYADFEKMVRAGATRIGASAGVHILKEARAA